MCDDYGMECLWLYERDVCWVMSKCRERSWSHAVSCCSTVMGCDGLWWDGDDAVIFSMILCYVRSVIFSAKVSVLWSNCICNFIGFLLELLVYNSILCFQYVLWLKFPLFHENVQHLKHSHHFHFKGLVLFVNTASKVIGVQNTTNLGLLQLTFH